MIHFLFFFDRIWVDQLDRRMIDENAAGLSERILLDHHFDHQLDEHAIEFCLLVSR